MAIIPPDTTHAGPKSKPRRRVKGKPLLRDTVRDRIKALIEAESLQAGDRLLPEKELAARFDVSFLTVRAALETMESQGLIERRQGSGTFIRQQLPMRPPAHPMADRIVAVVLCVNGHLFDDLNRSIISQLQDAQFMPMPLVAETYPLQTERLLAQLRDLAAIGCGRLVMIGWENYFNHDDALRKFVLESFPQRLLMSVFAPPPPEWNMHWVSFDMRAGYELAVGHLRERGHRAITYLAGEMDLSYPHFTENRILTQAYTDAMIDAGLAEGIHIHVFSANGQPNMRTILDQNQPTALVAMNDYRAACACKAFRLMNVRVPEDVAIIGFYNTPWSAHEDLTTIDVNIPAIAAAVRDLMDLPIESPAEVRNVLPLLVTRAST